MRIALLSVLIAVSLLAATVAAATFGEEVTLNEGRNATIESWTVLVTSVSASGTAQASLQILQGGGSTTVTLAEGASTDVTVGGKTINVKVKTIVLGRTATVVLSNEKLVAQSANQSNAETGATADNKTSVSQSTSTQTTTTYNLGDKVTIKEEQSVKIGSYTVKVDTVSASGRARTALTICRSSDCSSSITFNEGDTKSITVGSYIIDVAAKNITLGRTATVILSNERAAQPAPLPAPVPVQEAQPEPSSQPLPSDLPIKEIKPTSPVIEKIQPEERQEAKPNIISQFAIDISDFFRNLFGFLGGAGSEPRQTTQEVEEAGRVADDSSGTVNIGTGATAPAISVSVDNPNPPVDKVLTISATASDDSKVSTIKIYVDNNLAKTCTPNAKSGSCYYRPVYNSAGKHTFYAVAVDDSGITNRDPAFDTKTINVGADVTKPTVSVSHSPANPIENQGVNIIATAKDNQKLSKIELYIDDDVAKTCDFNDNNGICDYKYTAEAPNTKYTYYAKVTDAAGLTTTTAKNTIIVVADTIAPIIKLSISPDSPKYGNVIRLIVTATDNAASPTITSISFDGNKKQGKCFLPDEYTTICKYAMISREGTYTFAASAEDDAQKKNEVNSQMTVVISPSTDKTPPIVSAKHQPPVSTLIVGQDIYIDATARTGGNTAGLCSKSTTFNEGYTLQVELGVGKNLTVKVKVFNIVSGRSATIEIGDESFIITEGNSHQVGGYFVTVDSVAASGTARAAITVCEGDVDDYGIIGAMTIYVDGSEQNTCLATHNGDSFTEVSSCRSVTSFPDVGTHTYYATAIDSSENTGTSEKKSFDIIADTNKPYSIKIGISPEKPKTGETVTLKADAWDDAKISVIYLYIDGQQIATCPNIPPSANGLCTHDTGFYNEGKHTYYAEAIDFSDNKGKSEVRSFTVVDPLTVSVSHNPSNPKVNEAVSITATATDDEEVSSMSICIDSDPCIFKSVIAKSGTHTVKKTYQKEGKHTYYATAVDKRDNIHRYPATGTKAFSVGKPPTVTVTHSPLNPKVNEKVTFTATASDDVKLRAVSIMLPNNVIYGCTPANAVTWTCTTTKTFATAGTYTYSAQAIDSIDQITNTATKSFTVS